MGIALSDLNHMQLPGLLQHSAETFELAPWVAEAAFAKRPSPAGTALHEAMFGAVRAAPRDSQLDSCAIIPISLARQREPGRSRTTRSASKQA